MPSTTFTKAALLGVVLALGACVGGAPAPVDTRTQANAIAAGLRASEGVDSVDVSGNTVVAALTAPVPGAALDEAARARVADAISGTFVSSTCQRADLSDFLASGGTLRVIARGNDGVTLADVPVTTCG